MNFKDQVITIVNSIPKGRVTTYGTVANLAGQPRWSRLVGGILHWGDENIPWHRVINKQGYISTKCLEHPKSLQKALLQKEDIEVGEDFMINLEHYGWWG